MRVRFRFTETTSLTAPYQEERWNPASVDENRARGSFRVEGLFGTAEDDDAALAGDPRDALAEVANPVEEASPEVPVLRATDSEPAVRPPVAVDVLDVAGVSTARAWCAGEPPVGPTDGLLRVGEDGRWLCPPGFAACARAAREGAGRAVGAPNLGLAREGARDPTRVEVHDAHGRDAAIIRFSKKLQKGFSSRPADLQKKKPR
jgi:hypothetical protein